MNFKQITRTWRWAVVAGGVAVLAACGGSVIAGPIPTVSSLAVSLPSPTVFPTLAAKALTPVPTNTPAPTPTPLIHVVQPGDTLLGIALQYDVTLDELQQANGVLKPETLQIGQELIIPIGLSQPAGVSGSRDVIAPTPVPLPVTVENTARYQTPVGSSWVLGEVLNSTDQPVENVQVRVGLLNAAGVEVAAQTNFVALDAIPAGGRAPFSVSFLEPPPDVAGFQALVVRADPSYNHDARYARLQVKDLQTRQDGSQYRVTGVIVNTGSTNAKEAHLVITLYDKAGKVSGFRLFPLPDEVLAAGGSVPFFDVTLAPDPSAPIVAASAAVAQAHTQ